MRPELPSFKGGGAARVSREMRRRLRRRLRGGRAALFKGATEDLGVRSKARSGGVSGTGWTRLESVPNTGRKKKPMGGARVAVKEREGRGERLGRRGKELD